MKTRVYLDNCCFNRPFDDPSDLLVRLEAEAKMHVQQEIRSGKIELAWSFILDFENRANPYADRRDFTAQWKSLAVLDIGAEDAVFRDADLIMELGIREKDALHIACAVRAECDYFLTTDRRILKRKYERIMALNPLDYVQRTEVGI